jgi:hypothetical protein
MGKTYETFFQCCLCGGEFICGDDFCEIEFESEPGVLSSAFVHSSCAESHPMNEANR